MSCDDVKDEEMCTLYGTTRFPGNFNTRVQLAFLGVGDDRPFHSKEETKLMSPSIGACIRYVNCALSTEDDATCATADGDKVFPRWKTLDNVEVRGVRAIDFLRKTCNRTME